LGVPFEVVRVVASNAALELIRARGGRLYVWVRTNRCCTGGIQTLATAHEPPGDREFTPVRGATGFDLFVSSRLRTLPAELHLDRARRRPRVDAFWNGCAWIV
jgi:hypothetical protein